MWDMGKGEWSLGVGVVIDGYTLLILRRTTLLTIFYALCLMLYAIDPRVAAPAFSTINYAIARNLCSLVQNRQHFF